jgi:hypothetical protein
VASKIIQEEPEQNDPIPKAKLPPNLTKRLEPIAPVRIALLYKFTLILSHFISKTLIVILCDLKGRNLTLQQHITSVLTFLTKKLLTSSLSYL